VAHSPTAASADESTIVRLASSSSRVTGASISGLAAICLVGEGSSARQREEERGSCV
jgi:hypothetical protein